MFGKSVRMERIMDRNSGNAVIVPLDHGISMGPIKGIIDIKSTIDAISLGGATAVVEHKGIVPYGHRTFGKDIGLIVHLSASTSLAPDPNAKVIVTTVEQTPCPSMSTLARTPTSRCWQTWVPSPGSATNGACLSW